MDSLPVGSTSGQIAQQFSKVLLMYNVIEKLINNTACSTHRCSNQVITQISVLRQKGVPFTTNWKRCVSAEPDLTVVF